MVLPPNTWAIVSAPSRPNRPRIGEERTHTGAWYPGVVDKPIPGKDEPKTSRERQLANLRPAQKGEVRNPDGKNGREGSEAWRKFLDAFDPTDKSKTRRLRMHETWYELILEKDTNALKLGVEQDMGRAKQQIDLTSEDGSMSPLGHDSVADALRAAIDERRRAKELPAQEQPADDGAADK